MERGLPGSHVCGQALAAGYLTEHFAPRSFFLLMAALSFCACLVCVLEARRRLQRSLRSAAGRGRSSWETALPESVTPRRDALRASDAPSERGLRRVAGGFLSTNKPLRIINPPGWPKIAIASWVLERSTGFH